MNQLHLQFLASDQWANMLETDVLPWLMNVADLGDDVLEIGPGPGLTTDLLRTRTARVTAIEIDAELAAKLHSRLAGTNVEVIHGDAAQAGLSNGRFSTATAFSMLHHMPSVENQDLLFSEVFRVLRPGGVFVGVDSLDNDAIRLGHAGDIFNPVDPRTLPRRLEAARYCDIDIEFGDYQFRFSARKPPVNDQGL